MSNKRNKNEVRRDSKGRILYMNEFQRSNGQYQYKYRDSVGKVLTVYSWKLTPTDKIPLGKRECLSLREIEEKIRDEKAFGLNSSLKNTALLNDYCEKYLDFRKGQWKKTTYSANKHLFEKHIKLGIGRKKIADIKHSDILKFYCSLIESNTMKVNSVANINTVLQCVFDMAVKDDVILKNPCLGSIREIKKKYHWEEPKRHALTIPQQKAFINFIKNDKHYNRWANIFICFLGTGCRVSELVGLRIKDVNFDSNTISINHNLIYGRDDEGVICHYLSTTKTKAGNRIIPMFNDVREALLDEIEKQKLIDSWRDYQKIENNSDWIFKNPYGNVYIPQNLNMIIKKMVKSYNKQESENAIAENREAILLPEFSMHNLRHTFITRLCEVENNLKVIMDVVGHSDIQTTMNIYAEVTQEKKEEVRNDLEGRLVII